MIVKFTQGHHYRGPRTDHPAHPALPRTHYMPGDIVDIPVDYFEKKLEPYRFAHVHNAAAAAEGAAAAMMEDMEIDQLRKMIEKHGLEDKIEGSGPGGRAMKEDLVVVLEKHYKASGRSASDPDPIPDDAGLARMRVDDLVLVCEERGIKATGTGKDGKVLKADLVEALSEQREREADEQAHKGEEEDE